VQANSGASRIAGKAKGLHNVFVASGSPDSREDAGKDSSSRVRVGWDSRPFVNPLVPGCCSCFSLSPVPGLSGLPDASTQTLLTTAPFFLRGRRFAAALAACQPIENPRGESQRGFKRLKPRSSCRKPCKKPREKNNFSPKGAQEAQPFLGGRHCAHFFVRWTRNFS